MNYTDPIQQAVAGLSDAELDNVWYANVQAGDAATAALIGQVIADRLSSFTGFFMNLGGSIRFPHYESATGSIGMAASSVSSSAGNVASTIGDATKKAAQSAANIGLPTLTILGIIVVGGLILWKGKK